MRISQVEKLLNKVRNNDSAHSRLFDFMLCNNSYTRLLINVSLLDVPLTGLRFLKKDFNEENFVQKRAFCLNYLT